VNKFYLVLAAMVTVFGISIDESVVHAANDLRSPGEAGNNVTAVQRGSNETFQANFAYEMAQATAQVVAAPNTNVEEFKAKFSYATALVTAKVMPMLPNERKNQFAYEMAQITTKIINDQNLNIEKAKAEFAYKIAQLTATVLTSPEGTTATVLTSPEGTVSSNGPMLRKNDEIESKIPAKAVKTDSTQKAIVSPTAVDQKTYNGLINDLMHVGNRNKQPDSKVNIEGEIRYHYAVNGGAQRFSQDSSGVRVYLGFDTEFYPEWKVYGRLERKQNIMNFDSESDFSRLYAAGKSGTTMLQVGSFGYLMADGNIYDSGFEGVRADFAGPVKYTIGLGNTDSTRDNAVATAQYHDLDYDLEAGIYHYQYQLDNGSYNPNTIWTLSGNYNFSNFGVGAMALGSSRTDTKGNSNGYVFSVNYGETRTWMKGAYGVFAKYYNQPQYTYIAHGMNGLGNSMQGFKGYGIGMNYTIKENMVAGIEYYDLTDKAIGDKNTTWWNHVTYYF
jgi:hypothetical protein